MVDMDEDSTDDDYPGNGKRSSKTLQYQHPGRYAQPALPSQLPPLRSESQKLQKDHGPPRPQPPESAKSQPEFYHGEQQAQKGHWDRSPRQSYDLQGSGTRYGYPIQAESPVLEPGESFYINQPPSPSPKHSPYGPHRQRGYSSADSLPTLPRQATVPSHSSNIVLVKNSARTYGPLPHNTKRPSSIHSARPATSSSDDSLPGVTTEAVSELLVALTKIHQDTTCERPEYQQLRTQMYSESLMYSLDIHPTSLAVVGNVRQTMIRVQDLKNVVEFREESEQILTNCNSFQTETEELVHSHAFVLGNLNKLKNNMRREMKELQVNAQLFSAEARENEKSAKGLRRAGRIAWIIPPLATKIKKQAKDKQELGLRQEEDAKNLVATAQSIDTLYSCHERMLKVINDMGAQLNDMSNELQTVISNGRNATDIGIKMAAAERCFKRLKKSAATVIGECETFLTTRLKYPEAMRTIGAHSLLTPGFKEDWRSQLHQSKSIDRG